MLRDKIIFKGLRAEDYMHPEEKFFADRNPENFLLIREGLDFLNDVGVQFVRQITEGKWCELNRSVAPEVFEVAENTCRILDYPTLPKIFVRRERNMKLVVGGTDYNQMLVPDYVLEAFDLQMLYFAFGNAVSMFKSRHVQLATISSVICGGVLLAPVEMALQAYLRAADLSSDRGGLLCCQDFSVAVRCILAEVGMPLSELRFLGDEEILELAENYLDETEAESFDMLTNTATFFRRVSDRRSVAAIRLRELLNWYRDGYAQTLKKFSGRVM